MSENLNDKRVVVTGAIEEWSQLRDRVAESDWSEAAMRLTTDRRRSELLSWRSLLRRALRESMSEMSQYADAPILYRESGAPYIENFTGCFSVSHSREMAAVVLSAERCAVDIETLDRRYAAIESRYLSAGEMELIVREFSEDINLGRAVAWCAKEAAYKYFDIEGLDWLADMCIVDLSAEHAELTMEVRGQQLKMMIHKTEKYVMVVA